MDTSSQFDFITSLLYSCVTYKEIIMMSLAIIYLSLLGCLTFLFFKKHHNFNTEEAKGLIGTTEEIMRSFGANKVRR